MRRFAALPLAIALIVIASTAAAATNGNPDKELPFRGFVSGDEASFDFQIPDGRCVEMAGVADSLTSFGGSGHATHLGRIDVVAQHCSDLDTGMYGDGMLTITTANGDVLKGTYTNGVSLTPPPEIAFVDDFTFVDGGTGRFVHASGGGSEAGVFFFDTNEWYIHMDGVIVYDASNRSG